MWSGWRWRFVWPVLLATACLVSLCAFVAVSLFHEQATMARAVRGDIRSRRAAVELEECLDGVLVLEQDKFEAVSKLHDRARDHMSALSDAADEPDEREQVDELARALRTYLILWDEIPPLDKLNRADHDAKFVRARRHLETELLPLCHKVEQATHQRLNQTALAHERVLQQLAWGIAGVGALGGVAGLVLGFGLARTLSRSIQRLRVQVRDAAGKLDADAPEIVFTGEGDLQGLHTEIDRLTARIETVVETLHQREREVLRAEQLAAVGQLATGVAHEVRNPLTAIKMLVQAALEDGAGAALVPADLRVIEDEVRRIERSLQTFLDYARPARAEHRNADLLDVLRAVNGLIRVRAERQHVTVRVTAPPEPLMLYADPDQLRQVFLNLCLNALDVMPRGGTLDLRAGPAAGGLLVEVADTGPGVSATIFPQLFTPFATTKDTGLGLGLAISKRIVDEHGGELRAANRPDGASFFVTLPVRPVAQPATTRTPRVG